jgi:tetratricopeptide (TPR) repeat protein
VGRERELEQLSAALDDAFGGRGTVVRLAGEPGIGKTSVARALSDEAEARGATAVWGVGWSSEAAPAYWPWVQVARALVRRPGGDELLAALGRHSAWLAAIVPELRSDTAPAAGPAGEGRFHIYDALAELLRRAAERSPLVVVLDDLQWADEASLFALAFVARALPGTGVVLLGTYRATELPHDALGASSLGDLVGWSRRIDLHGLGLEDVRSLIESLGHDDAPDEVVRRIHDVTDGNPLFVSELLMLLEAQDRLGSLSAADTLPLPDGAREAIAHRLSPLPPAAREALVVGSVIGLQFQAATLSAAAKIPSEELSELLDVAVGHGVLRAVPDTPELYVFSHGLVQATLYDGIPQSRRVALHRAVGEALEDLYGDDVREARLTELAHHFLEAQDERATDYARLAGERAVRQFAYDQAARLFERALAGPGPGDADERISLLQALGEAQMRSGDTAAARATLLEAAESARRHDDAQALARAALACGIWGLTFGVDEQVVSLLEEAIELLDDPDLLAHVKGFLASSLYWSGETERRLALCDDALDLAREHGTPETIAYVIGRVMLARWGPDSVDEHMPLSDELIARARAMHDGELELLARNWRISVLMETGDAVAVDQEIARVEQMARELRQPRAMAFLPLHHGMRAITSGQFGEGERLMAESAEIGREVRGSVSELAATAQLLVIRLLQGRLAELEPPLRALSDLHPGMVALRCTLTVLLVQSGREDEARAELERLTRAGLAGLPRDNTHLVMLALAADAATDLGDEALAAEVYGWLEPYAGRWVVSPGAAALWPVDRSLGRLAGALGELDRARQHFAEARRQGRRLGALPTIALTAIDEATLVAAAGDAAEASRLAGEARALAEELGMAGVADAAVRLTGPAERKPAGRPGQPATGALRREGDVWTLTLEETLVRVKDAKGLHHLAVLLSHPGVDFHAADLIASEEGRPAGEAMAPGELTVRHAGAGDAGELLDAKAKDEYRRRLEDLREDIEEAAAFNDPERAAGARAEYEFIAAQLAGAVGLGGRDRRASSDAERARVNATRAIRAALRRIGSHDARLGELLDRTVRTGTFCAYVPDPERPIVWTVET